MISIATGATAVNLAALPTTVAKATVDHNVPTNTRFEEVKIDTAGSINGIRLSETHIKDATLTREVANAHALEMETGEAAVAWGISIGATMAMVHQEENENGATVARETRSNGKEAFGPGADQTVDTNDYRTATAESTVAPVA